MKTYTIDEIIDALHEGEGIDIAFSEADRQRVLTNPLLADKLAGLRRAGEELRHAPIRELRFSAFRRFETDGNRVEFESNPEDGYFTRRRRLAVFGILSWLYGREEDITALEDILWALCSEYTWALPAHLNRTGLTKLQRQGSYTIDLFAAETGEGIAEVLSLVGDRLSPIVQERCLYELKQRILDHCTDSYGWNTTETNNWVCVCNGNCGIAAIYAEQDPHRLAEILMSCTNAIQNYRRSISEDGACGEGLGYWAYGFGNYVYYADLLKRRTAGRIDLLDDERMHRTARFLSDNLFPKGQYTSFADMWGRKLFYVLPGLMSHLTHVYPDVRLAGYELMDFSFPDILRLRFGRELREFVWVDSDIPNRLREDFTPHLYPDAGLYMATSKSGVSLAAKAGRNNEPHNHNDVGSFMLIKNGERMLDDIGASEYDAGYFGPERYTKYFAPSSLSHNLPIINGRGQAAGRSRAASEVVLTDNRFSAELAGAYAEPTLQSLRRTLDFDLESGRLVLIDRFIFTDTPSALIERFICPTKPEIGDGRIIFGQGGQTVIMRFDPARFTAACASVTDIRHDMHVERITYTIDLTMRAPSTEETVTFTVE